MTLTMKARDRRCPACGGIGGKHTRLDCAVLKGELRKEVHHAEGRRAVRRRA